LIRNNSGCDRNQAIDPNLCKHLSEKQHPDTVGKAHDDHAYACDRYPNGDPGLSPSKA
jgi:hypothetical protein